MHPYLKEISPATSKDEQNIDRALKTYWLQSDYYIVSSFWPVTGLPKAFLHALEQYFTFTQSRAHFFRQLKFLPQTRHVFFGRSDFCRMRAMSSPWKSVLTPLITSLHASNGSWLMRRRKWCAASRAAMASSSHTVKELENAWRPSRRTKQYNNPSADWRSNFIAAERPSWLQMTVNLWTQ